MRLPAISPWVWVAGAAVALPLHFILIGGGL